MDFPFNKIHNRFSLKKKKLSFLGDRENSKKLFLICIGLLESLLFVNNLGTNIEFDFLKQKGEFQVSVV
jgi:hypothetical protein